MEECVSLTPGLVDMCKHVMAVYHIGYQACKSDGDLDNHTATQPVQMTGKWCRPQLEPYWQSHTPACQDTLPIRTVHTGLSPLKHPIQALSVVMALGSNIMGWHHCVPYSSSTAPSMPDSQPSPIYADAIFGMHAFWQNAAIGSILFQTYLAAQWRLPRNPLSILCHCCHQPLTPIPLRCPVQFNFQQESCNQDSLLSMGIITTSITSEKRKYIPEFSSLFHYKWRM